MQRRALEERHSHLPGSEIFKNSPTFDQSNHTKRKREMKGLPFSIFLNLSIITCACPHPDYTLTAFEPPGSVFLRARVAATRRVPAGEGFYSCLSGRYCLRDCGAHRCTSSSAHQQTTVVVHVQKSWAPFYQLRLAVQIVATRAIPKFFATRCASARVRHARALARCVYVLWLSAPLRAVHRSLREVRGPA